MRAQPRGSRFLLPLSFGFLSKIRGSHPRTPTSLPVLNIQTPQASNFHVWSGTEDRRPILTSEKQYPSATPRKLDQPVCGGESHFSGGLISPWRRDNIALSTIQMRKRSPPCSWLAVVKPGLEPRPFHPRLGRGTTAGEARRTEAGSVQSLGLATRRRAGSNHRQSPGAGAPAAHRWVFTLTPYCLSPVPGLVPQRFAVTFKTNQPKGKSGQVTWFKNFSAALAAPPPPFFHPARGLRALPHLPPSKGPAG